MARQPARTPPPASRRADALGARRRSPSSTSRRPGSTRAATRSLRGARCRWTVGGSRSEGSVRGSSGRSSRRPGARSASTACGRPTWPAGRRSRRRSTRSWTPCAGASSSPTPPGSSAASCNARCAAAACGCAAASSTRWRSGGCGCWSATASFLRRSRSRPWRASWACPCTAATARQGTRSPRPRSSSPWPATRRCGACRAHSGGLRARLVHATLPRRKSGRRESNPP